MGLHSVASLLQHSVTEHMQTARMSDSSLVPTLDVHMYVCVCIRVLHTVVGPCVFWVAV